MSSPLGSKAVIGIDPAFDRLGHARLLMKLGKFLQYKQIPHCRETNRPNKAKKSDLKKMIHHINPFAIGVGKNGSEEEKRKRSRQSGKMKD